MHDNWKMTTENFDNLCGYAHGGIEVSWKSS